VRLSGKKVVVTGSGRGIGRAIAIKLAREGADVMAADIDAESVQKVAEEIKKLGVKGIGVRVDVSKKEEVEKIFEIAKEEFGRLDVLVNNAGINRDALLHKMTDEEWTQVLAVNLTGVFFCTRKAAKIMRDQRYGRIINISSAGWLGNIGQTNYSASKAGVVGLSKTVARELAPRGITVNVICPGFIDTEMTRAVPEKIKEIILNRIPTRRIGKPEEVANVVAFLASDEASYVTGAIIDVGGGMVV
jgi:3-oxoacyl-(acyl-carrier-protein) reductase